MRAVKIGYEGVAGKTATVLSIEFGKKPLYKSKIMNTLDDRNAL